MLLQRVAHVHVRRVNGAAVAEQKPHLAREGGQPGEHEPCQERHCLVTPGREKARMRILVTGATDGLGRRVSAYTAGRRRRPAGPRPLGGQGRAGRPGGRSGGRIRADLASLADVRRLAADVEKPDALINNAGLIVPERRESADGYELGFAVNYLSHFVLTLELLRPGLSTWRRWVSRSSTSAT